MTESTGTPDPSITNPSSAGDAVVGAPDPVVPPEEPAKPAKKAAAKKAAAKKAAAPAPDEAAKKDPRSLYLPALPDGFEYTAITATGQNGETISVTPGGGNDPAGSASLSFEGQGLNRDQNFATMKEAVGGLAKAAKAMQKIADREAELAKAREAALDF